MEQPLHKELYEFQIDCLNEWLEVYQIKSHDFVFMLMNTLEHLVKFAQPEAILSLEDLETLNIMNKINITIFELENIEF